MRVGSGHNASQFVEFGTGITGKALENAFPNLDKGQSNQRPSGKKIVPKKGKFLIWEDPVTGEKVFAKATKGQKPKPFLRMAMHKNVQAANKILIPELAAIAKEHTT